MGIGLGFGSFQGIVEIGLIGLRLYFVIEGMKSVNLLTWQ